MKQVVFALLALFALSSLSGCAEYKEYRYMDFQMSREDAFQAVSATLQERGYTLAEIEETNYDYPEIYFETGWNMRDAVDSVYRGNAVRRKAYVRVITRYAEEDQQSFQPLGDLTEEERKKLEEEAARKKKKLELTTIGIAIRLERLSDVRSPLEAVDGDWNYEGPDNLEVAMIFGDLEVLFMDEKGNAGDPSRRSESIWRRHFESGGNRDE